MMLFLVQTVQVVQAVQSPSFILPRGRGGEKRWGLEPSVAVEPSEAIEQFFILQYSNTPSVI
jgi:hypothetical protein